MRERTSAMLMVGVSLAASVAVLELAGRAYYYHRHAEDSLAVVAIARRAWSSLSARVSGATGRSLNQAAWEATFTERGLPVPDGGPREGYGGSRVNPKNWSCGGTLYCEREQRAPGLYEIDARGFQRVADGPEPRAVILVVGGSVAWGAYASRVEKTYFATLAHLLAARGVGVDLHVLATGGWRSDDELRALIDRGLDVRPQVVVFLNGLNDLTLIGPDHANRETWTDAVSEKIVLGFLANMLVAHGVVAEHGASCLFALQRFLGGKQEKSPLEEEILARTYGASLDRHYGAIAAALTAIARDPRTRFVDCSEATSRERHTTFTDQWHLSDPGHTLLAEALAPALGELVAEARAGRGVDALAGAMP